MIDNMSDAEKALLAAIDRNNHWQPLINAGQVLFVKVMEIEALACFCEDRRGPEIDEFSADEARRMREEVLWQSIFAAIRENTLKGETCTYVALPDWIDSHYSRLTDLGYRITNVGGSYRIDWSGYDD